VSVLRANCDRDMRVARSATCRSVLSSNNEYETAWTMSALVRASQKCKHKTH
jgi:hypothetical protein